MKLLEQFIEYHRQQRLSSAKKHTLLAVSGGVDSVVMCKLYAESGLPFSVMHCNFQLRGAESDADEQFVKELAAAYGVQFFCKKFDTKTFAAQNKLSIQVAARQLRYEWFEQVRSEVAEKDKRTVLIATAHHLNDNIETIIYNLAKGVSLKGLRGIPIRVGNVIRPLLFATRQQLEEYGNAKKLSHREDSSNAEDKYARNKIRHQVIPVLKEINPGLEKTLASKIELLSELEQQHSQLYERVKKKLFLKRGNEVYIPILKLQKTKNASLFLNDYLSEYNFTPSQIEDIINALNAEPGKQFVSPQARIIKDRRFLILTLNAEPQTASVHYIHHIPIEVDLENQKLHITYTELSDWKKQKTEDKYTAYIDASQLEFPLVVRRWKQGDYFYPLGMGMKKKKLKKFFADEKVPLHEKEKVWIVESNQRIVWVAGYRMDERFKCDEKSRAVLLKLR